MSRTAWQPASAANLGFLPALTSFRHSLEPPGICQATRDSSTVGLPPHLIPVTLRGARQVCFRRVLIPCVHPESHQVRLFSSRHLYIPPIRPPHVLLFISSSSAPTKFPPPPSMSDLDHPLQEINCRKRKADTDDDGQHPISNPSQSPNDPILVDHPSPPLRPSHAPRQPPSSPWLSTDTAHAVWPSEHSPTDSPPVSPLNSDPVHARFNKRPRIDTNSLSRTHSRGPDRHPSSRASLPPHTPTRRSRRRPEHREAPSPSPSSPQPPLLRIEQHPPSAANLHPALQPPFPHVDLTSPHIPSLHPLINRQTLKELDLSAILRNPQLRTSSLSHAYYHSLIHFK